MKSASKCAPQVLGTILLEERNRLGTRGVGESGQDHIRYLRGEYDAWRLCKTSAAAVPQRSCRAVLPRHFHNKFHAIQNWVSQGSYKTRIWFNQKSRSGGFYVCFKLLGLESGFSLHTFSQCIFATLGARNQSGTLRLSET